MKNFSQIEVDLIKKITSADNRNVLDSIKTEIFGKKRIITELFKKIGSLNQKEAAYDKYDSYCANTHRCITFKRNHKSVLISEKISKRQPPASLLLGFALSGGGSFFVLCRNCATLLCVFTLCSAILCQVVRM